MCGGGPPPGTSCDSTALTAPPVSRPWRRMTIGMPRMFTFLPPSLGTWIGFMLGSGVGCWSDSFVSHRRAGWTGEVDDFKALEADFAAPFTEVRAGIIERIAKFDEHIQGHEQPLHILAPRVVDERFDGHQRAAGWQGIVGCANEMHLLLQIPVVENHTHRDDVGLGQRVFAEIARGRAHA